MLRIKSKKAVIRITGDRLTIVPWSKRTWAWNALIGEEIESLPFGSKILKKEKYRQTGGIVEFLEIEYPVFG